MFYNFYWDLLFGCLIVAALWTLFCMLGRKYCGKKEGAKEDNKRGNKKGERQPLLSCVFYTSDDYWGFHFSK